LIAAVAAASTRRWSRAHDRVQESNDLTAHAVVVALRETARKLKDRAPSATIFAPRSSSRRCASGRCSRSDVETLVHAVPNTDDGAAGTVIQLAQHEAFARRVKIVSGIRRNEAGGEGCPGPPRGRRPAGKSPRDDRAAEATNHRCILSGGGVRG
jgi:tRNA(adenine34) deaminase